MDAIQDQRTEDVFGSTFMATGVNEDTAVAADTYFVHQSTGSYQFQKLL